MRSSAMARVGVAIAVVGGAALLVYWTGRKTNVPVAATQATQATPATQISATAPVMPVLSIILDPNQTVTIEAVNAALSKGTRFLHNSRRDAGWGLADSDQSGIGSDTGLVLRALAEAGSRSAQEKENSSIARYLKSSLQSTRAVAERLRLCGLLGGRDGSIQQARDDAMTLIKSVGESNVGFHPERIGGSRISLIASAEAGRALAEARTVDESLSYWSVVDAAWRNLLKQELGKGPAVSPGGQRAGDFIPLLRAIDLVAVCDERMQELNPDLKFAPVENLIETALAELQRHYAALYLGPGEFEAMEIFARIMRSRGIRKVNGHDWYRDATALLLAVQKENGSWGNGVRDTAHALLFLSRGRAPVLFHKLQYADDEAHRPARWNNRPYDLARLTHWQSTQIERDFDWQVLNIDAPLEEWFDAPILYISGDSPLRLNEEHQAKLKRYLEQGGLIVANAERGDARFINSFQKLGTRIFPYEFRNLAPDHVIFNSMFGPKNWTARPQLRGISNGVRELMLLLPDDPARGWQLNQFAGVKWLPAAQLSTNIAQYATEWKLKFKEERFADSGVPNFIIEIPGAEITRMPRLDVDMSEMFRKLAAEMPIKLPPPGPNKSATLAVIASDANPDELPPFNGLRATMLRKDIKLNIDPLVLGKWTLQRYDTASIAAGQFTALEPLQRLEVKRFIETGGTLVIDATAAPDQVAAIESSVGKLLTDPKVTFAAPSETDAARFYTSIRPTRIGSLSGRAAIIINIDAPRADGILEMLLAERAK